VNSVGKPVSRREGSGCGDAPVALRLLRGRSEKTNGRWRRVVREVMWSAWDGPGLGHLRLSVRDSGIVADGLVLGVADGRPFRLSYEVRCDPYWRVRAARVGVPRRAAQGRVALLRGGQLDRVRRTDRIVPNGM
jgi:hypothetical protein